MNVASRVMLYNSRPFPSLIEKLNYIFHLKKDSDAHRYEVND